MEPPSINMDGFSRRLHHVIDVARGESKSRGHEYVGTEHLLLGVIADGGGVAIAVLEKLQIDLGVVTAYLDAIARVRESSGPSDAELPFTTRAKAVLELSIAEARGFDHSYISTEHLLLALVKENTCPAGQVLSEMGVTYDAARTATIELLGP